MEYLRFFVTVVARDDAHLVPTPDKAKHHLAAKREAPFDIRERMIKREFPRKDR
jgi:hypothetical protein